MLRPSTDMLTSARSGIGLTSILLTFAVSSLLLASGCGSTTPTDLGPDQQLDIDGPFRADDSLLYLDKTRQLLFSITPARSDGPQVNATRTSTGENPVDIAIAPDSSRAFVLNAGSDSLGVYDLESDSLSRQTVELDSGYQSITVGPKGDFVLLTFDSKNPETCEVTCNLAEIGVVDLRNGVPESAEFITINNQATDLQFAPEFTLGGESQRMVAALTPSEIAFIDLTALMAGDDRNDVRYAPLTISAVSAVRTPFRTVFDITPPDGMGGGENGGGQGNTTTEIDLFVLTEEGSDVTQIAVRPTANPQSDTKYDISINQLAAGNNPRDVVVLETNRGTRLLTIDSSRAEFTMIDVESGDSNTYELPLTSPPTGALRYTTVTGVEGDDEQTRQRVLIYSESSTLVAIVRPETIALRDDSPILGQAVEAIRLSDVPTDIRMDESAERERAIALHEGGGGTGVTILNLQPNSLSAIPNQGATYSDLQFVGDTAWGVFSGSPNIGRVNLQNGHPTHWSLPLSAEHILYRSDEQLALVDHERFLGSFTVLDTAKLLDGADATDSATYSEGVFLRSYFQKPL